MVSKGLYAIFKTFKMRESILRKWNSLEVNLELNYLFHIFGEESQSRAPFKISIGTFKIPSLCYYVIRCIECEQLQQYTYIF